MRATLPVPVPWHGATLHLVEPMGFRYTQRNLARAGLDYWDKVTIVRHSCVDQFLEEHKGKRMLFFTGNTSRSFYHEDLADVGELYLVFGRESRGIDPEVLDAHAEECVRLPMRESLRSLNLSNAVAIGVYETLRQKRLRRFCRHVVSCSHRKLRGPFRSASVSG